MTLQHAIEEAHSCGYKTGEARSHHDEALAQFQSRWFREFLATQPKDDRLQIRAAFDAGYRAGRGRSA